MASCVIVFLWSAESFSAADDDWARVCEGPRRSRRYRGMRFPGAPSASAALRQLPHGVSGLLGGGGGVRWTDECCGRRDGVLQGLRCRRNSSREIEIAVDPSDFARISSLSHLPAERWRSFLVGLLDSMRTADSPRQNVLRSPPATRSDSAGAGGHDVQEATSAGTGHLELFGGPQRKCSPEPTGDTRSWLIMCRLQSTIRHEQSS